MPPAVGCLMWAHNRVEIIGIICQRQGILIIGSEAPSTQDAPAALATTTPTNPPHEKSTATLTQLKCPTQTRGPVFGGTLACSHALTHLCGTVLERARTQDHAHIFPPTPHPPTRGQTIARAHARSLIRPQQRGVAQTWARSGSPQRCNTPLQ